ncbi:hypothetical protein [Rhodococcus opacus]|nr:hypothetical protein [Rhodococcus opacus]MDV6245368.1 hypothetical protein [Rhodococcus opacus]
MIPLLIARRRYYDRGIAARRRACTHLDGVTDGFDGIEDEADKLLA